MRRVPDPLLRAAARRPHAPALVGPDAELTWAGYRDRVAGIRQALLDAGVRPGDRVAFRPNGSLRDAALLAAVLRVPATAAPLSRRLAAGELTAALDRIAPQVVRGSALSTLGGAARTVLSGSMLEKVGGSSGGAEPLPPVIDLDRPATILHTSGSTGTPKAVVHRYENHFLSALGSLAAVPLGPEDRWLCALPLYHVGGLAVLIRCELSAACAVLAALDETTAELVRRESVTHLSLVTTQLRRLLEQTRSAPSTVRSVLVGGGPLPADLQERALRTGWPVRPTYGSTEMSSQIATRRSPGDRDPRVVGRPLPYRRVRIAEDGEIWVRGRTLFQGYLQANGGLDRPGRNGWFPTGDRGSWTEDGSLKVIGRIDRMFISGGENIDPAAIESALTGLDAIDRAVVVPVPDAEFGERPVAFVRWTGRPRPLDAMRARLDGRLARFKHPDRLLEWPDDLEADAAIDHAELTRRARNAVR